MPLSTISDRRTHAMTYTERMNVLLALKKISKIGMYLAISVVAFFIALFFGSRTQGHHVAGGQDLVPLAHADAGGSAGCGGDGGSGGSGDGGDGGGGGGDGGGGSSTGGGG